MAWAKTFGCLWLSLDTDGLRAKFLTKVCVRIVSAGPSICFNLCFRSFGTVLEVSASIGQLRE